MEKQQSILYAKSYDLHVEIHKVLAVIQTKEPQYESLLKQIRESISTLGISAYLAQEIGGKTSLGIRLYVGRKACYTCMYYVSVLRDLGGVEKKWAESVLERLVELLKLIQSSIATLRKKSVA